MTPHPSTIVIFGATGDLARNKLFPALQQLFLRDEVASSWQILAVGRRPYTDTDFLAHLQENSESYADDFLGRIHYYHMDFLASEGYSDLKGKIDAHGDGQYACLTYLAVDPQFVPTIVNHIDSVGLQRPSGEGWFRVIVEKPFGRDLESARVVDQQLLGIFAESQIYRIDHYLAKETVQNILAFRFANSIFEPLWSNANIDHVQITVAENQGIGTRGAYYDQTGAIRDVFQNHILQLLAILTMEEPNSFSFTDLSAQTFEVLKATTIKEESVIAGQYEGYTEEKNVAPDSKTETYVMAEASINTPRWQGVPFFLRTGKGLARRISEISVQFKAPDQRLFRCTHPLTQANLLTFRIQPDEGISLQLGVKAPDRRMEVRPVAMEFCYATTFGDQLPTAYARVLGDALVGDQSLAMSSGTIEESWRAVMPILADLPNKPLHIYPRDSWGPEESEAWLNAQGRHWFAHESEVCNGVRLLL